jgi:aldehyde:ferredoxin oxidoreductase
MDYLQIVAGLFEPYAALGAAVVDKGDMTRMYNATSQIYYIPSKERREAAIDSPHWNYPETYKEYFRSEPDFDGTDYEPICQFVAYDIDTYTILDLTGICSFWAGFMENPPFNRRALIADLVACVTGLEIDEAELTTIAGRTLSLVRTINTQMGLRRKDDSIAKPFFKLSPLPAFKSLDPDLFDRWIDRYYELKGWNSEGVPTRETLQELGLDDVWQDLERNTRSDE